MRFRFFVILLAIITSSACYIYATFHQTENSLYTGIRSLNASDYNQNTSWIDQAREGHFFMKNKFTSEPQTGYFVRPVYFALSQPFRFTSFSNTVVLHVLRLFCGIVLLISLFPILQQFEPDRLIVNRTLLLIVFTSGIGFLTHFWIQSIDQDVPEAFLFLSLGEVPHFIYSLLFLWAGIASLYCGSLTIYFLALLILWWEHPFEAVILLGIAFSNLWILKDRKKQILTCIVSAGVSLPPFLYYQHLKRTPAFSGWGSAQNLMASPNFVSVISGFFPLIVLGILGFLALRKQPEKKQLLRFLSIWIVVQVVMMYLPFPFQRRLIAGLQFPLALLSAYALPNFQKVKYAALVLLCSFGNIWLSKSFIEEMKPRQMPYYMSSAYAEAFQWLSTQNKESVVLSGFVTGNFIPGVSGLTSYMGHSSLTPNIAAKRAAAVEFFQKPEIDFLIKNRIQYVFWGLEERHLSKIPLEDIFEVAFKNEEVTILLPRLRPVRGVAFRRSIHLH